MADTALVKLQEATEMIEQIGEASSIAEANRRFHAAAAAIWSALQGVEFDCKSAVAGRAHASRMRQDVKRWHLEEERRAYADELVGWVLRARNANHHPDGSSPALLSRGSFHNSRLSTRDLPDGAMLSVRSDGAWWVFAPGTPQERRVRPPEPGGVAYFSIALSNPPASFRGEPLRDAHPIAVLRLAHEYVAGVREAGRAYVDDLKLRYSDAAPSATSAESGVVR